MNLQHTSVVSIQINRDRYRQWCYRYLPHTPLHTSGYTVLRRSHCHILKCISSFDFRIINEGNCNKECRMTVRVISTSDIETRFPGAGPTKNGIWSEIYDETLKVLHVHAYTHSLSDHTVVRTIKGTQFSTGLTYYKRKHTPFFFLFFFKVQI